MYDYQEIGLLPTTIIPGHWVADYDPGPRTGEPRNHLRVPPEVIAEMTDDDGVVYRFHRDESAEAVRERVAGEINAAAERAAARYIR